MLSPALCLALLLPAAPQSPVIEEVIVLTGNERFASGSPASYFFEIAVTGTGITGVSVQTPNNSAPQSFSLSDDEWQYLRDGFVDLDAIESDPDIGFGSFDLTFFSPGGNETATVIYDLGCTPVCVDPHTGFGDFTSPTNGDVGVALDPTLTWQCPAGTTCGSFGWFVELSPVNGQGSEFFTENLNPMTTSWAPGCLSGNTLYEAFIGSDTLLGTSMLPTLPSGNMFNYFEAFETTNAIQFTTEPALGSIYCFANPNSSGLAGELCVAGSLDVAQNDLSLFASHLPEGQFGYFLAGQTQGSFNPPGSQGIICLSGNIGRYNQAMNIIQGPEGSIQIDLSAIPVNPTQPVQPGSTWYFQCWFRDNNPGLTNNFTNGVSVTFL